MNSLAERQEASSPAQKAVARGLSAGQTAAFFSSQTARFLCLINRRLYEGPGNGDYAEIRAMYRLSAGAMR